MIPYFLAKSKKYLSKRSPLYVNPAEVESPAPAPITTESEFSRASFNISSSSSFDLSEKYMPFPIFLVVARPFWIVSL